jgi:geranylgeranyl diphosphate synthase type I
MGIEATVPPESWERRRRRAVIRGSNDAGTGDATVPASVNGYVGEARAVHAVPGRFTRQSAVGQSGYLHGTRFMYIGSTMTTASPDIDLTALIADTEGEIVRLVRDRDPSTHGLYEMVRYHLALDGSGASGGKRIRPLLGLLAYASITGEHQRALPGAAAVELGHNFSLVHDDIEDGDTERRHRPTLWTVHGVPQAINTGDAMFSLSRIALHRLTDLGFPDRTVLRLMRLFDETCLALCEGQYIDIAMSASDELGSVDLYFDMIGRKTAALIAASIEAGAVLATDDEAVIARYRGFGWALGLAFQLNDDLLGIWGVEQTTGKEPSDLFHKKKTLPVIYAWEHAGPEDRERLGRLFATADPTVRDVAEAIAILERSGAREYTRDQARRYRDEALAELDAAGVVAPSARARLEQIIVSVITA